MKSKDEALLQLTADFNRKTEENLSSKQVLKKFNNMKTRVKEVSDKKRTGNKKIKMRNWENRFIELWNGDQESENPILCRVPGKIYYAIIVKLHLSELFIRGHSIWRTYKIQQP